MLQVLGVVRAALGLGRAGVGVLSLRHVEDCLNRLRLLHRLFVGEVIEQLLIYLLRQSAIRTKLLLQEYQLKKSQQPIQPKVVVAVVQSTKEINTATFALAVDIEDIHLDFSQAPKKSGSKSGKMYIWRDFQPLKPMTASVTECIPEQFSFARVKSRQVIVNFQGGTVTSDAGLVLLAELDKKKQITARFAQCFTDYRNPNRIQHSVKDLIAQRIYGLIQGYEDLNDHDQLRYDPVFALAVGKVCETEAESITLAGKSTLNRLEHCPESVTDRAEARYHRIEHHPKAIADLLVELFLESYRKPPVQIVLDLDVTDDQVHGNQELAFFNTYYDGVCYAPLYIFCAQHLLAAKLRPSNVDPAAGALEELQRVIGLLRRKWPQTRILVRGDSAYAREDIMSWCESQPGVDYVFGLASNSRLQRMSQAVIDRAAADYQQRLAPVVSFLEQQFHPEEDLTEAPQLLPAAIWYHSLCYTTHTSWSRSRRVVVKVACDSKGLNMRFVVTSLPAAKIPPGKLYTTKYCPRGAMENCIKEQQLELFSDRTSTHTFEGNQLRLWFSSIAYVLMQALRQDCLSTTELAQAQVGTIRTKLLKLGARVLLSARRILIAISSGCPYQAVVATAYQRLQSLPEPG